MRAVLLAAVACLALLAPAPYADATLVGYLKSRVVIYGDSMVIGPDCGNANQREWHCDFVGTHIVSKADFGVNSETCAQISARFIADRDVNWSSTTTDMAIIACGTNNLQAAAFPDGAPTCTAASCFIDPLRDAIDEGVAEGLKRFVVWVPIPWRPNDTLNWPSAPDCQDLGGCCNPGTCNVVYVAGGTRGFVKNTLRGALVSLAAEYPTGQVTIADGMAKFESLYPTSPANMRTNLYKDLVHPSTCVTGDGGCSEPTPGPDSGSEVLARVFLEAAIRGQ